MITLREYQKDIADKAFGIIETYNIVMLNLEVRTGKTLTALHLCKMIESKNVLFVTKKKAISSIMSDFKAIEATYKFTIINYESLHKITDSFDVIICDEYHSMGAFPKPSKRVKEMKRIAGNAKIIYLSGTPTPESFSQIFHPLSITKWSPFARYINFYKWCADFVNVTKKNCGYAIVNDYSDANIELIKKYIGKLSIDFTQQQSGFSAVINEHIVEVEMMPITYALCNRLKKENIIEGKTELILADTGAKMQQKLHQMYSGTVKFESGNRTVFDLTKANYIRERWRGEKIAIFYKFIAELQAIKTVYGDGICDNIEEFNTTDKSIAFQIVSGREGTNLSKATALIFYNIDFSATSYWQARDRMTTIDRTQSDVYWIFAKRGIERMIYKAVSNKKNYTLEHFRKDLKNGF